MNLQYASESDYWNLIGRLTSHSGKTDLSPSSVGEIKRTFAGTTCAIRAMDTHLGENDGLVSSDRESAIQGSRPQGAKLEQHVCNLR